MIILNVKVHPGAGKNEVTGFSDDVLSVRLTAQPEKGKANAALIKLLSDRLGIAKSRIEIIKGATSRKKTVGIEGLTTEDVIRTLTENG